MATTTNVIATEQNKKQAEKIPSNLKFEGILIFGMDLQIDTGSAYTLFFRYQIFKSTSAARITHRAIILRRSSFSLKSSMPASETTMMVPTLKLG